MEYYDLVLTTIVVLYPITISVLVALGVAVGLAIGIGSLAAVGVIFHALFFRPPR